MATHHRICVCLLGCALALACADDQDTGPIASAGSAGSAGSDVDRAGAPDHGEDGGSGGTSTGDAAGAGGDSSSSVEPLYVVSTGVISGEDFLGYLVPFHSFEAGTTFNLDNAAELGGGAWIFNRPGDASVYVASLYEPTIVRWEVKDEGDFVKHETLNFTNLGIGSAYLAATAPIFSATKSYFADEEQDQIIVWNPEAMELIGTIALGDDDIGNLRPIPEGAILVRGDKLVVTVGWRDADDTTLYSDHVRVVTIDTNTDEIVDSRIENRNVHEALNTVASDGTAYYSPYSLYAAYTEIGAGHGASPLVMRILPGDTSFDQDFLLDLRTLVGGRPAGDYTLIDDDTALIRAWHPEIVDPVDPSDWQAVLWGQAGFKWWRWHVGDDEAVEIANQKPGAQGATVFKIDGKTYTTLYADDLLSTDVVEITSDGELVPTLTSPGAIVGGALRVH